MHSCLLFLFIVDRAVCGLWNFAFKTLSQICQHVYTVSPCISVNGGIATEFYTRGHRVKQTADRCALLFRAISRAPERHLDCQIYRWKEKNVL
jgi:hypothetical protein